jgi:hypothetical protein
MAGEKFTLKDEEVFVKFIKKQKGNIVNENHILYGGFSEFGTITYYPRQLKNGHYMNVLTDVEKEGLEIIMGLPKNALSIYNKKDNYWDTIKVEMKKEGKYLNLGNPEEFIQFKILESYNDQVAPSLKEYNRQRKATYKFVIIRGDEESKFYNQKVDIKKEAFKALGKLEDSLEAMTDFLLMYGTPLAKDSSPEFIKSEINRRADENPKKFLQVVNDPNYKVKVLLSKAVRNKIVRLSGGQYHTSDGLIISFPNETPTLSNAINFLESNEGHELRVRLEGELDELNK